MSAPPLAVRVTAPVGPQAPLLPEQSSTLPPASKLPQPHMRVARTVSAALGALEVLALALLNPLAGLFLAVYTWQIKYTSQIMLEPLPSLMSALAVLCYFRARSVQAERKRRFLGWLILGEPVTTRTFVASVIIVAAVAIITTQRARAATESSP